MKKRNSVRCFVAASIDYLCTQQFTKQVALKKASLQSPNLRWIPQRNWHITLQFIGEVDRHHLEALCTELSEVCNDHRPFEVSFESANWFPSFAKPIVLACRVIDSPLIFDLAKSVQRATNRAGVRAKKDKKFRPHLSIARLKRSAAMPIYNEPEICARSIIDEFALFESRLTADGPIYTTIERFRLMG